LYVNFCDVNISNSRVSFSFTLILDKFLIYFKKGSENKAYSKM